MAHEATLWNAITKPKLIEDFRQQCTLTARHTKATYINWWHKVRGKSNLYFLIPGLPIMTNHRKKLEMQIESNSFLMIAILKCFCQSLANCRFEPNMLPPIIVKYYEETGHKTWQALSSWESKTYLCIVRIYTCLVSLLVMRVSSYSKRSDHLH